MKGAMPIKKRIPIYIILGLIVFWILDVWLFSTLAALIVKPPLADYYSTHPLQVSLRYFSALFGGTITEPDVFKVWKSLNLGLLLLAGAFAVYFAKIPSLTPMFKENILGSAAWLGIWEARKVFNFSMSPGILFGKHASMPVVLPPEARGNRNVAVLGPPGSGKSRAYVRNNMFQAVKTGWSVIVTDPKGELTRDFRKYFEDLGYQVKVFNLVDMVHSDRWNPLSEVTTDIDAQMFCEVVIANTGVPGRKGGDPFWDRAEMNLLKALALYVVYELPPEERNMGSVYKILASGDSKYLDAIFKVLPYDHPAKMPFNIYAETSPQVRSGVIIGLGTRLQVFQNSLVRNLTETSDIIMDLPGQEKYAYFCIVSDMDHTFDFLASLFFSFLFINLTRYADRSGGELTIPVNFLLDEFCNIGHIPDFPKKISTMRGRGIACSVIFQSIGQLKSFYPDNEWETILADCDSWLVLGVKDVTSAEYISKHMGVGTIETTSHSKSVGKILDLGKDTKRFEKRNLLNPDEIVRMDRNEAILSAFGLKPFKLTKMDYTKHPMSHLLKPSPVTEYCPEWSKPKDATQSETTDSAFMQPEAPESAGEEDAFWA
jgi:type IV secretion system protein VirD4